MLDPTKPPQTLAELAQRSFVEFQSRPCLGVKDRATKTYQYASFGDIAGRVRSVALGLSEMGIERGQRVAILAENRPEWAIADIACQMCGLISVPLFSTLPAGQVAGILRDCGAKIVVVSDKSQRAKIEATREQLPDLQHIIVMDEADSEGAMSFAELENQGAKYFDGHPGAFESLWPAAQADDVATIIYTSGTTGEPKGVMLSHRNLVSNVEGIGEALKEAFKVGNDEVFLSFLPLAHIYERTAGFWVPIRMGCAIAYCESLRTVDKNLVEAAPTFMFCVPRLCEALRDKLFDHAKSIPEGQREKYLEALQIAQKAGAHGGEMAGAPVLGFTEKIKHKVYDAMVYAKIRERFGGRLKAFVLGGAPLPPDVGAMFIGLGINVLEGYGLTETSPVIAVNRPGRIRLGSVGEVLPSVQIKIAGDGEIVVRGPSITKGYWNKPTETKEAIDPEGWFHTGDIGALDGNVLRITDRKKDLLVLANGKKVAPAPIEMRLTQSKYIGQVVLLGDHQKAVSALIVPKLEALREFAAGQNLGLESDSEILAAPAVQKLIRDEIDTLSGDLADFEKIKKFSLIEQPFSVEGGELTPTLKIKRRVVAEKYATLVD